MQSGDSLVVKVAKQISILSQYFQHPVNSAPPARSELGVVQGFSYGKIVTLLQDLDRFALMNVSRIINPGPTGLLVEPKFRYRPNQMMITRTPQPRTICQNPQKKRS